MSGSKGGQGQGQGGMSSEMAWLAGIVVFMVAVWLAWTKARPVIVYADYGVEWLGYSLLYWTGLLDDNGVKMYHYLSAMLTPGGRYDPSTVQWEHITGVNDDLGRRMRWITPVIIGAMGVWVVFKMKGDGFKRQYSLTGRAKTTIFYFIGIRIGNKLLQSFLKLICFITFTRRFLIKETREWAPAKGMSFIHYQSQEWRVALPSAHFNPDVEDESQNPARTPMEWMRDNKIPLSKRNGFNDESLLSTEEAFRKQLGPIWEKIETAPTYVQALAIMFALNRRASIQGQDRSKKQRNEIRDRLNEIYILDWSDRETEVKKLIEPYFNDKKLIEAINRRCGMHAFLNTAIIGLYGWGGPFLEWGGGKGGELATAKFRWLKRVDRTLFYCLNNVGRRRYHIEGGGAVSHFQAEYVVRGALAEPHVDEAVEGLEDLIEERGILDIEDFFRVENDF